MSDTDKRFVAFAETVERLAVDGWGTPSSTVEDAQRSLMSEPQKLAAVALLDLVRCIKEFGKAVSPKGSPSSESADIAHSVVPEWASKFPDSKVGDLLYSGDLDDGFSVSVVVATRPDGYVRVVDVDPLVSGEKAWATFATDSYATTSVEAVRKSAAKDIEYHSKHLAYAQEAMAACDSGDDLSKFIDGYDEPDED